MVVKGATARVEKKHTKYRSYKKFDETGFAEDVGLIPFQVAYLFDDIDDVYWAHDWLSTDIINEHAPVNERVTKLKKPAYINGNLRRAVFKKQMFFNKFKIIRTPANWELYCKQRNHVTKLKKPQCGFIFLNDAQVAPSLRISGPQSNLFYPRRGLMEDQRSFCARKIK